MKRLVLTAVLVLAVPGGCTRPVQPPPGSTTPTEGQEAEHTPAAATTAPPVVATPEAPGAPPVVAPPPKPRPVHIKIIVRSIPPKALVFWGRKKLGETPVTLVRPRDSGPVDLVVRNDGYFPVHTRAYTFRNDKLYVRMTKLEDRMTLFGAKHEAPPAPDGGTAPASAPDGGVLPMPSPEVSPPAP